MRILLTHHFPLEACESGQQTRALAFALAQAGHAVRILAVDDRTTGAGAVPTTAVVVRAGDATADLDFDLPWFATEAAGRATFEGLSEAQEGSYREALRKALDREVDEFDPQIVHAQHLWLFAQLVLETGVPYVTTAWGPELSSAADRPRLHALAGQAAENASRILVADEALAEGVRKTFDLADAPLVVLGPLVRDPAQITALAGRLVEVYQAVLDERFGR